MGGKYCVRTNEEREFGDTTDYYVNSLWEYMKLRIIKRNKIIFVQKQYSYK